MTNLGSYERRKKRLQLWKKAIIHFALSFTMGFFTGFVPTSTASFFAGRPDVSHHPFDHSTITLQSNNAASNLESGDIVNRSSIAQFSAKFINSNVPASPQVQENENDHNVDKLDFGSLQFSVKQQQLLIIVTTTRSRDRFQEPFLTRLAHTLSSVEAPVLWIVVQACDEAERTAKLLRSTGVMYRQLTFKESFTNAVAETEHQTNLALTHIAYHRLAGIVHFAEPSNVYGLQFFEEIRQIEVLGAWPVALVSSNTKKVLLDGPICRSSKVVGWFLKDLSNNYTRIGILNNEEMGPKPSNINTSGFAFNSSILWDPKRLGGSNNLSDTSQDSFRFVHDILRDEAKVKGIPANCSIIMQWNLYIPRARASHQKP